MCRVQIHRWALHIDSSDDILSRLSEAEQKFHRTLVTARAACLQETFLQQMPDSLDNLDVEAARLQEGPRTGVFVYASIEEDLGIIPGGAARSWRASSKQAPAAYTRLRSLCARARARAPASHRLVAPRSQPPLCTQARTSH